MSVQSLGALSTILPDSAEARDGALCIGGCRLADLAEEFGTPLYIYDEDTLRAQARRILGAFDGFPVRVSFAAKACATIAVLRVFREVGLGLDTVSLGEIEAGLRAGFSPRDMHLHGNAKSVEELNRAIDLGLGVVVVDNPDELERLDALGADRGTAIAVWLRVNPTSLAVDTHPHLRTSGADTKFGLSPDAVGIALEYLARSHSLRLSGLHAHPGSQIADALVYRATLEALADLADRAEKRGLTVEEISVGGGWAVPYRVGDAELTAEDVVAACLPVLPAGIRLAVEPGRALVARAAIALYRVVAVKRWSGSSVIAVDGGMGDNPRPALYGARYAALSVRAPAPAGAGSDRVVGRYCEEGDVLAGDVCLRAAPGDLVAIPVAGAYQLSMASAYNLVPPPAVALVGHGAARLIVRRGTVNDLLAREL